MFNIFFFIIIINKMNPGLSELVKRAIKYIVEGLMVAIVAFVIPQKALKLEEIAIIALMAAATFSILDTFTPSIGAGARTGAGFGIGANLVGFPAL
jgi:branched-subunit amino acid transport protein|tara:strand:- start:925 stop:1212 length:288 start_codon:yes stop_codon:yes gene_type:complete